MASHNDVELKLLVEGSYGDGADAAPLSANSEAEQSEEVSTPFGIATVRILGDTKLTPLLTIHDLGLDAASNFDSFFSYPDIQDLMKSFCVYHITLPGQLEGCATEVVFPSLVDCTQVILAVMHHFSIRAAHLFVQGAGSYIAAKFGLAHPKMVLSIVMVNGFASPVSWAEWARHKYNAWGLQSDQLGPYTADYMLWYWLGNYTRETCKDLEEQFTDHLRRMNFVNMGGFIQSVIQRPDIGFWRAFGKPDTLTLKCPVMLMCGDYSPTMEDTVELNSRLDPANSQFVKLSDVGGLPLHEAPAKTAEATILFFQGQGYCPHLLNAKKRQEREMRKLEYARLHAPVEKEIHV